MKHAKPRSPGRPAVVLSAAQERLIVAGELSDCELAQRWKLSRSQVARARRRLGIENTRRQQRRPWQPHEIELLGTDTDAAIAERLGRGLASVALARTRRGIPSHIPHCRTWTAAELRLLATDILDREIAERLGCSREHVTRTRKRARAT